MREHMLISTGNLYPIALLDVKIRLEQTPTSHSNIYLESFVLVFTSLASIYRTYRDGSEIILDSTPNARDHRNCPTQPR